MSKFKSFKKCLFLVIGILGLILPVITHLSLWTFGAMAGVGLTYWILPYNNDI